MIQKKRIVAGLIALGIVAAAAAFMHAPSKWSELSFEAVVQQTVTQPDGEVRLVVARTTEIHANPLNALHISERTALIGMDGEAITVEALQPGCQINVTLKDSSVEETPFYYPTVYKIKRIGA